LGILVLNLVFGVVVAVVVVVVVVVNEFGCASLLYLKTEKETSHLPHLRLQDIQGSGEPLLNSE